MINQVLQEARQAQADILVNQTMANLRLANQEKAWTRHRVENLLRKARFKVINRNKVNGG